jgi:drug/metabolite transporter (DMT)-like permease
MPVDLGTAARQKTAARAYLAWMVVCVIWGTTYLAIRIALDSIPPFVMGGFRYTIAGLLLVAVLRLRGEPLPQRGSWGVLAVLGVLLLGFGNGGVVWAEQYVPSGLTAVLVGTSALWMTGVSAALPGGAHLTRRQVIGLVIGFSGIVVLVWPELSLGVSGRTFLAGVASTQIACLGWAFGSAYARRHDPHGNVLTTAAFEMLFGGIALFAAATAHREWAHLTFTMRTSAALAYLVVFGAVVAFSAYAYALKHLPVALVSTYAYVNPVIAVILGTLVLAEPFTWRIAAAGAVVIGGMLLVRSSDGADAA